MNDYNSQVCVLKINLRERIRKLESDCNREIYTLKKKHKIRTKECVNLKDIELMIKHVLETGENGTKTIRNYVKISGKSLLWQKDIKDTKAKKLIETVLLSLEESPEVVSMKKNKVYDKKEIGSKSVTGALNKLSKQLAISKQIDELREEVSYLHKSLADRIGGKDWKPEAIRLRRLGKSYGEIKELLGVSKSSVGEFLKAQQELGNI